MMRVGFVGLGAMGSAIVPRLLAAGHAVTGWNRTRARAEPLLGAGMRWADSPRAVAGQSEVVISILTDAAAVKAIALGENGVAAGLPPGGVFLDMSTIAPDASRAIAAEVAKAGRTMLDAPISGSPVTLVQGKASIMVGGDRAAFERVKPVLLAIGQRATYIGANGLAAQMKLAINLVLMVEVIAFGEGVALAEKGGEPFQVQRLGGAFRGERLPVGQIGWSRDEVTLPGLSVPERSLPHLGPLQV